MDAVRFVAVAVLMQYADGTLIEIGVVSEGADARQVITNNVTGQEGRVHWFQERHGSVFQKAALLSSIRKDNFDIIIMAPDPARRRSMEAICPGGVGEELCLDIRRYDLSWCRAYVLEPHLLDQLQQTSEAIHKLTWTTTTIFSDGENWSNAHSLASKLSQLGVDSELVFVKKDGHNLMFLKHIMQILGIDKIKQRLRFVLVCSLPHAKLILREAEEWDKVFGQGSLLRHFSQWLLLLPGSSLAVIEEMDLKLDHLAVLSTTYTDFDSIQLSQWVVGAVQEVLSLKHTSNISDARDTFLQIVRRESKPRTLNTYTHTLLWKPHGRKFSRVQRSWYDASLNDVFPNLKLGLNQRELRAASLEFLPFVKRHEINGRLTFTHAVIDLLDDLKSVLNFTYFFTEPADGEWGIPVSRDLSNYTGMIGMLQRGEIDIIAAPVGYTWERDQVADFLPAIHESYNGMIFRDSRDSSKLSSALTEPFRWQVYAVGGATLLGVILLYLAIEWNNPFYKDAISIAKRLKPTSALDTVMYLYGSTVHQGGVHLPESSSGRILISFWWMYIIVMTAAYSGNLIASLTVTRKTTAFTRFDELLEVSNLKIGLIAGTVLRETIETSNDSLIVEIREKIEASRQIDNDVINHNPSVHMEKVMTETYAFLHDISELEVFVKISCDVYILKEKIIPLDHSLLLPQDSPLTEMFTNEINRVLEIGLMKYWIRKWKRTQDNGTCPFLEKGAKPVGLEKLSTALLALGAGALCSGVCLVVELVVKAST